jgi:acetyltransferase-like isoleucine patch superfamily enzyme
MAIRALPKTIVFNLIYFKLRDAIRLPVWISHHVWLKKTGGSVIIDVPRRFLTPGLVRIGFLDVGIFDPYHSRSIWDVSGEVIFRGKAQIGHGSKISTSGKLELGDDFTITAESSIVCKKSVKFGAGCLLSWDVLVMDTDFHKILDDRNNVLNQDAEVQIGDKVWIGCRSLILKGVTIGSNSVVAANTTLAKPVHEEGGLIVGHPARVARHGIKWER